MVIEATADHLHNSRLTRRLKRRRVINEECTQDFCGGPAKKNVQRIEVGDRDEEYWNFVNNLSEPVYEIDRKIDTKFVGNVHHNNGNRVSECKLSNGAVDPDFMTFLQHLVPDGRSYKLEISIGRKIKVIKYEEEEKLSEGPQINVKNYHKQQCAGTTRVLRSAGASKKEKIENTEKLGSVFDKKRSSFGDLNGPSRAIEGTPLRGNPANESQLCVPKKELNVDCSDPLSNRLNGKSNKISGTNIYRSTESPCKSNSDSDSTEEDYKIFLTDYLSEDDHNSQYTAPGDGQWIVHENNESNSDSELMVMDIAPCKPSCTPLARKSVHTTMDLDSGKDLPSRGTCSRSDFRERLMQELKRPYDPDEYQNFLEKASCRSVRLRHRELRNGVAKDCPLDSLAKSYLGFHKDLAQEIELVRHDRPKTLNLLRGFFYWLKNSSHEGAFLPWKDASCLNVLPKPEL